MSSRTRVKLLALPTGAVVIIGLLWARTSIWREATAAPQLAVEPPQILANGYDTARILIKSHRTGVPRVSVLENLHGAVVEEVTGGRGHWEAHIRAGVVPGRVRFQVVFPGAPAASTELRTLLNVKDSMEDGTPDFLRLDDEHDRQSFRRWFTYLAEAQYFHEPGARSTEINDCAALIRYSYREALHTHDSAWTDIQRLAVVPPFDSLTKYQYPYTPLGAALFRVRSGPLRGSDLADGTFAEFADAQTLWRWNCHKLSRELLAAVPGDLLFFRQRQGQRRFHSMIYIGESQIRGDGERYLVYHTGPEGGDPGEMRRLTVDELMRFPQSEWRPLASNPSFLGVYRWNILCPVGTN